VGRVKTEKDEYPISNREYPMSKWAVALIGMPYEIGSFCLEGIKEHE
jgi:hypothetical protein